MEMEIKDLVFDLILNISLLSVIASLLAKIQLVQDVILQERRNWKRLAFLSVLFGGIIMLSTYIGIMVGEYNMNTKVIGSVAAGLLGGPLVGMYASLIGSVYVYVFSPNPAFAMASAFSVVLFGLLGGGFYPYFQRGKWKYRDLFLLTCFAEVCEMVALLRLTVPIQMALETVLQIAGPMILLNSVGMLIFISSFNTIFVRQDLESTKQLQRASELSRKSLPFLVDGLHEKENIHKLSEIILEATDWTGVMVTDETRILEWRQKETRESSITMEESGDAARPEIEIDGMEIPEAGLEAMKHGKLFIKYSVPKSSAWYEWLDDYTMVAAPFLIKEKPVGSLIVLVKKQWVFRQSEMELLSNFVTLGSFLLAMSRLEKQEQMRQKAEFKALQFQVNPHFLFNALNTIACVCRENSGRARELLLTLADYFRYNLGSEVYMVPLEEEIEHVQDYLEIEKARFEENLTVTYDLEEQMDIRIPTLILQPIVENAVRHGRSRDGKRTVHIAVWEEPEKFVVKVSDEGGGFDPEVLKKLYAGEDIGRSIGLSNVHRRMQNIYGDENGLQIESSEGGSCVTMCFWKGTGEE